MAWWRSGFEVRSALTGRSSGRPPARFACLRPPLNSNVRALLGNAVEPSCKLFLAAGRAPGRGLLLGFRVHARDVVLAAQSARVSSHCSAFLVWARSGLCKLPLVVEECCRVALVCVFLALRHCAARSAGLRVSWATAALQPLPRRAVRLRAGCPVALPRCLVAPRLRVTFRPNRSFERTASNTLRVLAAAAQLQR